MRAREGERSLCAPQCSNLKGFAGTRNPIVYMHKFSYIELIALRPSTMYAKTGVKTTVAASRTCALNWRADAAEKIRDPDSGARSFSDAQFLCAIKF